MGLYLAVFDGDEELDGVEVGSYADYGRFIDAIVENLEDRQRGARFPILVLHSDCDGEWSPEQCGALIQELDAISDGLARLPPIALAGWQKDVAKLVGIAPKNLLETFFDVDGEPLVVRLRALANLAASRGCAILFQ